MAWFRKEKKPRELADRPVAITEGLWVKCDECKEIVYRKEVEQNLNVCPKCGYHFRIDSQQRIHLLLDEEEPRELMAGIRPTDPLGFVDFKRYKDRIIRFLRRKGLLP